jgi:SAM-dependent methyltransferase
MTSMYLTECVCCGSKNLEKILDLGTQPLANSYRDREDTDLKEYPLKLNLCLSCFHSQLSYCVAREELFENYSYSSGTSNTLLRYFDWFASRVEDCLSPGERILEIASNDGSLLECFKRHGMTCVGIDPARNIVAEAKKRGVDVVSGYWPADAEEIEGNFELIVCMNVIAHVADPKSFLAACKKKLKDNGLIVLQPSQVRMFENFEFDTCYHEHISFFNSSSISALCAGVGLRLINANIVKIHGDSPLFLLSHENSSDTAKWANCFQKGDFYIDENLFDYEKKIRAFDLITYRNFSLQVDKIISSVKNIIEQHRSEGYQIVFVGAAAKAMTVFNAVKIRPDLFVDEAPQKIGKISPCLSVSISPLTECAKLKIKTLFVITAWNFKVELIEKIKNLGTPEGSKFLSYFPALEVES